MGRCIPKLVGLVHGLDTIYRICILSSTTVTIWFSFYFSTAVSELRIDVRPSQGVMQGVNVSLQCLNRTNAAPVKVTKWEFMGHLLEQPSPRIRISHPQTKHQLDIMSVEVSDTGRYSCTSESNGNKYNASLYITVYSGRK